MAFVAGGAIRKNELMKMSADSKEEVEISEGTSCVDLELDEEGCILNPEVLDKIFAKLNAPDLKSVRLVCKVWEEVGSTALGKRTHLVLNKMLTCCEIVTELPPFNIKLAKRIRMVSRCVCGMKIANLGIASSSAAGNFVNFSSKVQDVTEELQLIVSKGFATPLMEVLKDNEFPNLKLIMVSINVGGEDDVVLDCPDFPVRPNLKSVSVSLCMLMYTGSETRKLTGFDAVLQGLINSAPNLEDIAIFNNCYPDLNKCNKLRHLTYYYCGNRSTIEDPTIDVEALKGMLEQIKDSVEKLDFNFLEKDLFRELGIPESEALKFCLPKMPNLAILTVGAAEVYRIENSLDMDRLPKLKHLSITTWPTPPIDKNWYTVRDFCQYLWKRHDGIDSLNLIYCTSDLATEDIVQRVILIFPNVKKLKLELRLQNNNRITENSTELYHTMSMLEAYKGWDLTSGRLRIIGLTTISEVVMAIDAIGTWKGLKTLLLSPHVDHWINISEFSEETKAAFLSCKTFKCVKILGVEILKTIFEDVKTFIASNNLPIYFE